MRSTEAEEFEVGTKKRDIQSAAPLESDSAAATAAARSVSVLRTVDDTWHTSGPLSITSCMVGQSSSIVYNLYVQIARNLEGTYNLTDESCDKYEIRVTKSDSEHIIRYSSVKPTIVKVGYV